MKRILCLGYLLSFLAIDAFCTVRLPRLVSDGMVLQRDARVRIWGWAESGETVKISFLDSTRQALANEAGEWSAVFSGLEAGGPYEMVIAAGDTFKIRNILVGDVWVCSGQSNMDINMDRVRPLYEEEIRNAGNEEIRYFSVPASWNFIEPQEDLPSGKWENISRDNILAISAVAYFFAGELYRKYHVPVGIIRSSLGGSPAEAWMSEDALKAFPQYYDEMQKYKDTALIRRIENEDKRRITDWYMRLNSRDAGYKDPGLPWYNPRVDISGWDVLQVPGYWADQGEGEVNGVAWFRKDIELKGEMAGKAARLNLGRIVDADSVFVNGVYVGSTGYQYPPRRYRIPEGLLTGGKNSIVIRLISNGGRGGFVPGKPYELIIAGETFDLKGKWYYRFGTEMEPSPSATTIRWKPGGLYNGMLNPLTDYTIKGVVWYQGESNASRAAEYKNLFPALIRNWRNSWHQGDFPFIYVQLPNYMESKDQPSESEWALLREAQAEALSLPNTGMAVAIDLGEWNDIHPLNKKDVGGRLALAAEKTAYHETGIIASGPRFKSMKIKGNRLMLTFTGTGSGLVTKGGGKLMGFAIAGKDMRFVWAKAKISGQRVVVWNAKVRDPVAVRYAWADNPKGANLYNKEGLPAAPFRTDDWIQ